MEKSSIKSAVVRFAIWFDPNYMKNIQDSATKALGLVCENFLTLQRVSFTKYVEEVVTAEFEKFESFDKFKQSWWIFGYFSVRKNLFVYVLSHDWSSVEKWFSINMEHLQ